jgi:tetratricopeptide (TPR) repeat protein
VSGDPAPYTLRGLQDMLGVSRGVATRLVQAGFVTPTRGPRNAYRFTFQDVVLLRTAHALQAAQIPPRRILRTLRQLKASLPRELPLSGLRITAVGKDIAVRDGGRHWSAESGQLLLDLEVTQRPGSVAFLAPSRPAVHAGAGHAGSLQAGTSRTGFSQSVSPHTRSSSAAPPTAPPAGGIDDEAAAEWLARGDALEREDPVAAEAAYRQALALAPAAADAWLNLGALLCEAGRCAEAVALYDRALAHLPDAALLHYNRAIALEDQQRWREALAAYEQSIRLQPDFADAHYNAALLHERLGEPREAIRRFSAYRRLSRR